KMHRIRRFAAKSLLFVVPLFAVPPLHPQAIAPSPDPLAIAVAMNYSAINLARLARKRTANPTVSAFAEAMVKEHSRSLEQLQKEYGFPKYTVTLSPMYQAAENNLSPLSGSAFDHEFARQVVADYQVMVNFLEVQSTEKNSSFSKT